MDTRRMLRSSAAAVVIGSAIAGNQASAQPVEGAAAQSPPATASLQAQDSIAEGATQEDSGSQDILVTARRRNERLLDVPVAVTAIGAEGIARYKADNLASLTETVPSVSIASYRTAAGGTISIRGIGTSATLAGFEQAVSLVVDGVPVSSARVITLGYFDLQQLEIMKGPQALFFGKNSPAGVISLSSVNPTAVVTGQVQASYEVVGDEAALTGILSGPIAGNLTGRIALRYRDLKGWLYNDARPIALNPFNSRAPLPGSFDRRTGERELLGRVSLGYESGNFNAVLKAVGSRLRDDGMTSQNIGPCPTGRPQVFVVGVLASDPYGECKPDNHFTSGDLPVETSRKFQGDRGGGRQYGDYDQGVISLNANLDLDKIMLSSTSGYVFWRQKALFGFDQTTYSSLVTYSAENNDTFSEEVRLSTNLDGAVNVMVGGFYQHGTTSTTGSLQTSNSNNPIANQCYNPTLQTYSCYTKDTETTSRALSAFGQVTFKPIQALEIAGGVRFTQERKETRHRQFNGIGSFDLSTFVIPGSLDTRPGRILARFRDSNWSPEVTISYHPTANSTVYAAFKTGYKSGGFGNSGPLTRASSVATLSFGPENVRGFEGGAKGRFGPFRLEATAFAYDFRDLQVNTFDATRFAFVIDNAGKVEQRGADLQVEYEVSPEWSLRGNLAYTHNRFKDYVGSCYNIRYPTGTTRAQLAGAPAGTAPVAPPNCSFVNATALTLSQDFNGRAPARSPDWAGNAGFTYRKPIGGLDFAVNGDLLYSGGYFPGETMSPGTYQDNYWKVNASVQLGQPDKGWSLQLVGRNLTNKYVVVYAAERSNGLGSLLSPNENRGVVGRGREITLQAGFKF